MPSSIRHPNFITDGLPVPEAVVVYPYKNALNISATFRVRTFGKLADAMRYAWDSLVDGDAMLVVMADEANKDKPLLLVDSAGKVMLPVTEQEVGHVSRWLDVGAIRLCVHNKQGPQTTTTGTAHWALELAAKSLEEADTRHVELTMPDGKVLRLMRAEAKQPPEPTPQSLAERVCNCVRGLSPQLMDLPDWLFLDRLNPFSLADLTEVDWVELRRALLSEFDLGEIMLEELNDCKNVAELCDWVTTELEDPDVNGARHQA